MNTATILTGGAVITATLITIPLGLAPVFSRRNNRRDADDHAAVQAFTQQVTSALVAQIRNGADTATLAINAWGHNPAKIALRAYRHTIAVDARLLHLGNHDAAVHSANALHLIDQLTNTDLLGDYTACTTPLANAVAAELLLAHLATEYPRGTAEHGITARAAGYLNAAVTELPNARAIKAVRLDEHDPFPLHAAHAVWRAAARDAGLTASDRVPEFNGDVMVPVTAQTAPVYPPGHRLAHTNAMDCDAALVGIGGAR